MATLTGPIWSDYHRINLSKAATKGIQYGLEARRSTIFFRRAKQGELPIVGSKDFAPDVNNQPEIETWRKSQSSSRTLESAPNVNTHTGFIYTEQRKVVKDYVAIIDVDVRGSDRGYEIIKLPAIPRVLEWNSESNFTPIKPIGRNTPFYHYTGAEDKLQFEIDWYATTWDKREVITNCRRIESLTKADGYTGGPHRVLLKWGDGDVLFDGIYFQVIAAPYKLVRFNKAYRNAIGEVESGYMLPVQAYQQVTLVRIDKINTSKAQIEFVG